jgi:hypothetical protein
MIGRWQYCFNAGGNAQVTASAAALKPEKISVVCKCLLRVQHISDE